MRKSLAEKLADSALISGTTADLARCQGFDLLLASRLANLTSWPVASLVTGRLFPSYSGGF